MAISHKDWDYAIYKVLITMNITHCLNLGSAATADVHREAVLEASN